MIETERFKELAEELGFEITPIYNRPDIASVKYRKRHIFTIPVKMYATDKFQYKDLLGYTHPNYFQSVQRLLAAHVEINMAPKLWNMEDNEEVNHVHNYA